MEHSALASTTMLSKDSPAEEQLAVVQQYLVDTLSDADESKAREFQRGSWGSSSDQKSLQHGQTA